MKRSVALLAISVLLAMRALFGGEAPADGYALFTHACANIESLGFDRKSTVWDDLRVLQDQGGEPSAEMVNLLQQAQEAFSLISDAHHTPFWELPDITTFSAESEFPWLSPWRRLNRIATTHAILLYLEENPNDAIEFLVPFNAAGMKITKAGTIIHVLVHISCRSLQYPVLASSIDNLPEATLADELVRAKEQYHQVPTISELLAGEQYMVVNTAKELFDGIRMQEDLVAARKQMINGLRGLEIDKQALARIESGEALCISQWERQFFSDLKRIQALYTNALYTHPSAEFQKVDDGIEKEIDQIGNGMELQAAMAMWNLFMTSQVSGHFSMPDAEQLHSQVGRAISHQLLSMMIPAVASLGIRYREYIAYERLLLIRLAARLYVANYDRNPKTLQQLVDGNLLEKEMIIDPLSGEIFRIKSTSPFEVYSVGRNLVDNGGIQWDNETEHGDTILVPLERKWEIQRQG